MHKTFRRRYTQIMLSYCTCCSYIPAPIPSRSITAICASPEHGKMIYSQRKEEEEDEDNKKKKKKKRKRVVNKR